MPMHCNILVYIVSYMDGHIPLHSPSYMYIYIYVYIYIYISYHLYCHFYCHIHIYMCVYIHIYMHIYIYVYHTTFHYIYDNTSLPIFHHSFLLAIATYILTISPHKNKHISACANDLLGPSQPNTHPWQNCVFQDCLPNTRI